MRRRQDDFWYGIGHPLLRSCATVLLTFGAAALAGLMLGGDWFVYALLAAVPLLFLLDRFLCPDKEGERRASRRWFGLEE